MDRLQCIRLCIRHSSKDIVSATIRLDAKLTQVKLLIEVDKCSCFAFAYRPMVKQFNNFKALLSLQNLANEGQVCIFCLRMSRIQNDHTKKMYKNRTWERDFFLLIERRKNSLRVLQLSISCFEWSFAFTSIQKLMKFLKFASRIIIYYLERGKLSSVWTMSGRHWIPRN